MIRKFIRENFPESIVLFSGGSILGNVGPFIFGVIEQRIVIAPEIFIANIICFGTMFAMGWTVMRRTNKADARKERGAK